MKQIARGRAAHWTREKIDSLTTPELRQLRENAVRLLETEIAALCEQVLVSRPHGMPKAAGKAKPRTRRKPAAESAD